ncbi:MAG TPA: TonB-dependent receptor, partial [Paludibacteraceae bacterium]|nr:TonB-dependent receptor [Paludibacteraceae bacterium]
KKPVLSPRANLRYTPIENIILRVSYSSGYRAPQTYEEDLHVGAVGGEVSLITLDPNLKPEYSHSISGSVDLYKRWGQWDTNLTLEGFFTQLNDVFTLVDQGYDALGNLLLLRTNASGARVGGLNVEGKLSYRRLLAVQLGYTYQQSRYIDPVEWSSDPTIAPQNRMFRTPDSYGYGLININPVKDFSISLNGKYTGKMLVQHFAGYVAQDQEVETKPFWDLGFKLAYEIPLYRFYTLEINAGMKNVLDSYQPDIDRGVNRDAGYVYGPSLPRSYYIGFNLKI